MTDGNSVRVDLPAEIVLNVYKNKLIKLKNMVILAIIGQFTIVPALIVYLALGFTEANLGHIFWSFSALAISILSIRRAAKATTKTSDELNIMVLSYVYIAFSMAIVLLKLLFNQEESILFKFFWLSATIYFVHLATCIAKFVKLISAINTLDEFLPYRDELNKEVSDVIGV